MVTQLGLFDGETRKKIGQEQVSDNNKHWRDCMISLIEEYPKGHEFTMNDVRDFDIGEPSHVNAYGALLSHAGKLKLIRKTGVYVKSMRPEAHSRMLPIWVKIK